MGAAALALASLSARSDCIASCAPATLVVDMNDWVAKNADRAVGGTLCAVETCISFLLVDTPSVPPTGLATARPCPCISFSMTVSVPC
jgi:hypothetical protein